MNADAEMPTPAPAEEVVGVILAGGVGRRMGGRAKALLELGGVTLAARALARLRPQVKEVALNVNADRAAFSDLDVPVVADTVPGHAGPLAGVLAGMRWARAAHPDIRRIVTVAVDTPFFPTDLVARLHQARAAAGARLACAASGGRRHPVFGLWPVDMAGELEHALCAEGLRRIETFVTRHPFAVAEFSVVPCDPFFNINRPQDLKRAERLLPTCEGR